MEKKIAKVMAVGIGSRPDKQKERNEGMVGHKILKERVDYCGKVDKEFNY